MHHGPKKLAAARHRDLQRTVGASERLLEGEESPEFPSRKNQQQITGQRYASLEPPQVSEIESLTCSHSDVGSKVLRRDTFYEWNEVVKICPLLFLSYQCSPRNRQLLDQAAVRLEKGRRLAVGGAKNEAE